MSRTHTHAQNFFTGAAAARDFLAMTGIRSDDLVVEVGAGRATLTRELARAATEVQSYEIDPRLAAAAHERTRTLLAATVEHRDFFDVPLPADRYVLCANPPFNRTADLLRRLMFSPRRPAAVWITAEAAAVKRILGEQRSSIFACLLAAVFTGRRVGSLSSGRFHPRPRCKVSALELRLRDDALSPITLGRYEAHLRIAFGGHPSLSQNLRCVMSRREWNRFAGSYRLPLDASPSECACAVHEALFRWKGARRSAMNRH